MPAFILTTTFLPLFVEGSWSNRLTEAEYELVAEILPQSQHQQKGEGKE